MYEGLSALQVVEPVLLLGRLGAPIVVLTNAANAMAGMALSLPARSASGGGPNPVARAPGWSPLITATMFGVTTPCVEAARKQIETAGYEVLVFHATGTGGMTMESFVSDGLISGVLDVTTTELADELVGGVLTAGPDRLTAAALKCLGGEMQARFAPRNDSEANELARLGHPHRKRKYQLEDLAAGSVMLAATGVTPGDFLAGVRYVKGGAITNSVVMRSATGTVRLIEAHHHFDRAPTYE